MPAMTGVDLPMIDFLKLASEQIPNLAGIKFTHENLMDMRLCLDFDEGRLDILHGRDEMLLSGLALGARGAIGSTYNYLGPLFTKLIDRYLAGNITEANELQLKAIRIIEVLIKYGGAVKAGKAMMKLAGIDLGTPRLPVATLTKEEESTMFDELKKLEFARYSQP
jgi:N-acetylneuraminate lyase